MREIGWAVCSAAWQISTAYYWREGSLRQYGLHPLSSPACYLITSYQHAMDLQNSCKCFHWARKHPLDCENAPAVNPGSPSSTATPGLWNKAFSISLKEGKAYAMQSKRPRLLAWAYQDWWPYHHLDPSVTLEAAFSRQILFKDVFR